MGRKTPLDNEPRADEDTRWFLSAYSTLSRSRTYGMGSNPISLVDTVAYWENVGNIGPLDEFIAVMQGLDAVYLADQAEKAKAK